MSYLRITLIIYQTLLISIIEYEDKEHKLRKPSRIRFLNRFIALWAFLIWRLRFYRRYNPMIRFAVPKFYELQVGIFFKPIQTISIVSVWWRENMLLYTVCKLPLPWSQFINLFRELSVDLSFVIRLSICNRMFRWKARKK